MCVYENEEGTKAICPVVVFETTARLDILQVKTFNDDDVTDKNLLKVVSEWKEAKRYLLSKGRTVYRELEEDESADIENSSDSNS